MFSLLGLGGFGSGAYAQLYPVQLTPVFNSPYSVKISDYTNSMDTKMQLLINPTDISISQRQVRLKLYIQGNGLNVQSSDYIQGQRPIFINGGELQTLTNTDIAALFRLENLQGISPAQYANGLPDGIYNFCFEMYDFVTNQKISQKSCASLYLILNDPPLLNTPQRNEQIASTEFPNILFTWTPRQINATNVSYKFELKQLIDPTLDPQIAFQMSPVLYEETLFGTALLYNLSMPILTPGMRYAWRVKAISTTGLSENAVFKNDGYSEIYSFKYTASCAAPTFLLSESQSSKSVKITWEGTPEHTRYQVQYKKQDVRNAQWFSTNSLNTQSLITNLEPGVTYQFRVGSSCDPATEGIQSFTYSGISTFTTPTETSGVPAYNCGITPEINIQNQKPLTNLIQSETFKAGDFPVTILELQGENSPYSGRGYIIVPYLADTKIAVEFKDIVINTDYQLIGGVVETSYNPEWKNVADLEDFTGEGQGGQIEETVPFAIKDIIINANGDILVNGFDGEQITIPGGKDTVITEDLKDADGNSVPGKVYTVDSKGNGSNEGIAAAPGGKPDPKTTDGVDASGQANAFTAQGASMEFSVNDNSKYAFDVMPKGAPEALQKLYKKVGSVALPYKAVVNGFSDTVLATLKLTDTIVKPENIVFKTQNGALINATRNNNTFELTVKGNLSYAEEQILATVKQGDKWKVVGAFMLVHISPKEVNVALIPTDLASQNNLDTVIANTQAIYGKVGVKINFTKEKILENFESVVPKTVDKIETVKNTLTSTYSTVQQSINNLYKGDGNSYVLFLTNKTSSTGQQGYMRLNGQFGYVFKTGNSATAAHELGHGIFKLEHPFETYKTTESSTDLLMDYSEGTVLNHQDWKQINDPAFKFYAFQSQASGEYETDGHYSTVYLVSLMLGMSPDKAKQLAVATEAPDTDVHSETNFELDDTWINGEYQETIHSLTGGFHGTEEFLTAIQFIYTPRENILKLGELLHRFGDTYAHTKLDNIKPKNLNNYQLSENSENEIAVIKSWKGKGSVRLNDKVEPWILFFNYYLKKYGMGFFTSYTKQREVFKGKTLKEALKDIYLVNKTDKYIVYGGEKNILGITKDHAFSDGSFPDKIYLRPDWYLDYVSNLAWLLSKKYNLNSSGFDIKLFEKMTNFAVANTCSLKGIIDYEIAKKMQKTKFYVPVLYSNPTRIAASYDAIINTDYYQTALDVVDKTKLYISKDGIYKKLDITPIKDMNVKYNSKTGFFRTAAFEINLKK